MTAPETLEELRAAVADMAARFEAHAGLVDGGLVTVHLRNLLPPAPEPIKVGDRVRGSYPDWDHFIGEVMAITRGGSAVIADPFAGESLVPLAELSRVPPEVGEGWRHPTSIEEADAAWEAGVIVYNPPVGDPWAAADLDLPSCSADTDPANYRVPPGWAEGRERIDFVQAATDGREIDGENVTGYTVNSVSPGVYVEGLFIPASPDGKVWVDPLPKQETVPVEPHESEDPEELAAAVAAGLLVEWWSVGGGYWFRTSGKTAEQFKRMMASTYRIHGTVPGYGETGGAS